MIKQETTPNCSLCGNPAPLFFCRDRNRDYLHCPQCDLVFVPSEYHLPRTEEKERYDLHQNSPDDPRYRNFLNRLFQPIENKLSAESFGLDFGCGPGPTLSIMFEEAGHSCKNYDPHYANHPDLLEQKYDFLTCSETMEHMYHPGEEFEQFTRLVKPGGWIGIMTQLHNEAPVDFERWHYKDDETHVCFFSKKSFETLEKTYDLTLEFHSHSVILFRK